MTLQNLKDQKRIHKGLVIKSTGSLYKVVFDNGEVFSCTLRGKLRMQDIRSTNPVAVGDYVEIEYSQGAPVIKRILKRKNYIIRKATNLSKETHILASNIDQALLLVTLTAPRTTSMFIDRFLLAAEAYRIPVIIVFNKIDLLGKEEKKKLQNWQNVYESIGYKCEKVSLFVEADISKITSLLSNKVSMIAGHSGVGKSTLINAIDPKLKLKTRAISDSYQSGQHTTTFAEMFPLQMGGYIIDTPGIKGFGLVNIERNEISHFFVEIFKYSNKCKFNNCTHIHEPACAVLQAVKEGQISEFRYYNYLNLFLEDNTKYRM